MSGLSLPLSDKVALVTGASRGVGKGIAVGLAKAGATVYITGRTVLEGSSKSGLPGTIKATEEITNSTGGKCIAVQCDHRNDDQVEALFKQISAEQDKLDCLVNNVWGGYEHFTDGTEFWNEKGFWTVPVSRWDAMFQAGVRSHYVASTLAVPLLQKSECGLIVNLSYFAAQWNDMGVAYSVAKAATDKMAACMAEELRPLNIAAVSLYPGLVRTESVLRAAEHLDLSNSESPEFIGRAIEALASDPAVMHKSGQVLVAAKLAREYGFTDTNGQLPEPLV